MGASRQSGPIGSGLIPRPRIDTGTNARVAHGAPGALGATNGVSPHDVFDEIEAAVLQLYQLPHNRIWLATEKNGMTPEQWARAKAAEVRSGLPSARREDLTGPRSFLRVVGDDRQSRPFSGEWWFDVALFHDVRKNLPAEIAEASEKDKVLRDALREVLAISTEWNPIIEVWLLQVPKGTSLVAYSGPGSPQKLFANQPLTAAGNRVLAGEAKQYFFLVKDPFMVQQFKLLLK